MEREGVVNIDDINLDQPLASEDATQNEEMESRMKQRKPYKRKTGQARIKDTTQSKKIRAEKKKARKAMKEKGILNRMVLIFVFIYISMCSIGSLHPIHWFQLADDAVVITSLENENQLLCSHFSWWCKWTSMIVCVDKYSTSFVPFLLKLVLNYDLVLTVDIGESCICQDNHIHL